jgi:hypothetical protein
LTIHKVKVERTWISMKVIQMERKEWNYKSKNKTFPRIGEWLGGKQREVTNLVVLWGSLKFVCLTGLLTRDKTPERSPWGALLSCAETYLDDYQSLKHPHSDPFYLDPPKSVTLPDPCSFPYLVQHWKPLKFLLVDLPKPVDAPCWHHTWTRRPDRRTVLDWSKVFSVIPITVVGMFVSPSPKFTY